jgi:uncharacterized protein YcsI (UPF0317 family)
MATPLRNTITWDRTDPRAARRAIRSGGYTGYTAAIAAGYVQANICILPRDWSADFLLYCQRILQALPADRALGPGRSTAAGTCRRSRYPHRYSALSHFPGRRIRGEVTDITGYWRDDLVTFALGCSFSFEEAMLEAGLRLKFLERNNVAGVYVTNVETAPAGPFRGPLLVTMRSFKPADAIRAIQITSRFPNVHGAPVHIGDPGAIGVDLSKRYQNVGDGDVGEGEMPVFWACGLTPQLAVKMPSRHSVSRMRHPPC